MPMARVIWPDGGEWMVSQCCELLIPGHDIGSLSAQELGQRILDLLPRVHRVAPHMQTWRGTYWSETTLEMLEEWMLEEEERIARQELARKLSPQIRKEIRDNYDHFFMTIGRRDGFHCQKCQTTYNLTIEHIIAVSNGGTNDLDNLQLLCGSCNSRKSNK